MCTLFANLYMLLKWGPHMVNHGDPIYMLYLYDHNWLVELLLLTCGCCGKSSQAPQDAHIC